MDEPGDPPTTRAAALVEEPSAQARLLGAAQARQAALMVEFGQVRRGLDERQIADRAAQGVDPRYRPGEFASMEIGLAVTASRHSVQRLVAMAERLRHETPDVWDAWLAGDIDQFKAVRINHALLRLTHDASKQLLNDHVVPVAACKTAELLGAGSISSSPGWSRWNPTSGCDARSPTGTPRCVRIWTASVFCRRHCPRSMPRPSTRCWAPSPR